MSWQLPTSWSPQGGRDLAPSVPRSQQQVKGGGGKAGMLLLTRQNGFNRGDRGRGGEGSAWAVACPCRQVPDAPLGRMSALSQYAFPMTCPLRGCALGAVTSCSGISPERHPPAVRPSIHPSTPNRSKHDTLSSVCCHCRLGRSEKQLVLITGRQKSLDEHDNRRVDRARRASADSRDGLGSGCPVVKGPGLSGLPGALAELALGTATAAVRDVTTCQ
ncbi:hypothetical protein B0T11DRAFT_283970 [Plectosphaerella cucumerina]|uniref:Uncharacterized protein n=1 Tax=Plectosphaerella cucumerina TaxID=40658 RepID=A0A8K0X291_9PEZI|nr:hypothetical protein B0T11DRAFT_283970 [Plectosphaerella cucumerina]